MLTAAHADMRQAYTRMTSLPKDDLASLGPHKDDLASLGPDIVMRILYNTLPC